MIDIKDYLLKDESIKYSTYFGKGIIYVTNKRLFIKQRKKIQDILLSDIVSISFYYTTNLFLIGLGIIVSFLAGFLQNMIYIYFVIGFDIVIVILCIILKMGRIELWVKGLDKPIHIEARKVRIDKLLKILREY